MICDNPGCAAALAAARADNARLRAALLRYGRHDDEYGGAGPTCASEDCGPETCDCGFDAALAATGLTPEGLRRVLADVYEAGQAVWHDHGVRVKDHKAASVAAALAHLAGDTPAGCRESEGGT